jgi:tetratricopeptide (TPR) repeat protein
MKRSRKLGGKMNKKLSLRVRVIILIIFCFIGVLILIHTAFQNENLKKYEENVQKTKNEKITAIETKNKENKEKAETIENEKQKQIDNLTEEGYEDFGAKNYEKAIDEENQALALDDNNARAHAVKGIALSYAQLSDTNFKQGLAEIDRALQIEPNNGYARFNRAITLERYGYYDEALTWYDKALQVDNFVWSYYGKACIYGRKGDVPNAVKYLKIAIGMQANIKDEARSEEDFANVRNSEEFQQLLK